MSHIEEGTLLWEPTEERKQQSNLYDYMAWLKREKGLDFKDYSSLWQWSVDELELFWESLWEYFNIQSEQPYETILTSHDMPGNRWFPEATINYTEHIFRQRN
ncbi:MAG TPA: acetyl-coenzyme A synthetase N-terminal domain-containing protein, partial [Virgibacillus sp.]|nr:acetyl-coenzyme A synthetase N-terminal domain-containing protein [Virgibacillus sp.]